VISLVVPCYNETAVLRLAYQAVRDTASAWHDDWELILVDDGSSDDTWAMIEELARSDAHVRGARLSRNFGHQAAMGAGMELARGQVVVVLDADLQDPPRLIEQMLQAWRDGADVVFARRRKRLGESWFKRGTALLFYRLLDSITAVAIPRNVGDFALMDTKVVKTLLACREHALFWRGLRSWTGFRQVAIEFDRPERAAGETKYTFKKMARLAINGLMSFSDLPLRLPLYAGLLTLLATGVGSLAALLGHLTDWFTPASLSTLGLFFLGGVQLVSLGVIGEYLNRIHDEVRNRPRWIIAQMANEQVRDLGRAA
jgi:dolichol-phosphate mannosyltransferase